MKKIISGIIISSIVIVASVSTVMASNHGYGRRNCSGLYCSSNYVDSDGDGVCDNFGSGRGKYFVDSDGDGVCDNLGSGKSC